MGKQQYICGTCKQVMAVTELRRNRRNEICCPSCGSEDITRHLTLGQRFCTYLLVSNFY